MSLLSTVEAEAKAVVTAVRDEIEKIDGVAIKRAEELVATVRTEETRIVDGVKGAVAVEVGKLKAMAAKYGPQAEADFEAGLAELVKVVETALHIGA